MDNKRIIDIPYDFFVEETESGKLYMSVLCGTSAVFSVGFYLNQQEIAQWKSEGESYFQHLSYQVRDNPDYYYNRSEKD
jgi:hypothetical protein